MPELFITVQIFRRGNRLGIIFRITRGETDLLYQIFQQTKILKSFRTVTPGYESLRKQNNKNQNKKTNLQGFFYQGLNH